MPELTRSTLPGTVQIRVLADPDDTERIARVLSNALIADHMQVVDCTMDYADRHDPSRRKFHIVAIPGGH